MRSIDKVVESAILPRTGAYKPERVALAAALCPELLGEKKRWTRNPKTIVEAERIGEECGRSMRDIKLALVEWASLGTPYETMIGLSRWDAMLAAWVASALAERVSKHSSPNEGIVRDVINHVHRVVKRGVPDDSGPRNVSLILEGDITRGIQSLYDSIEYARTEDEGVNARRVAIAMMPARASIAILTDDPKSSGMKNGAMECISATSRTLRDFEELPEKKLQEEVLRVMANAIMSYPLQYTGSSGAISASSSVVPAALAGALLGAVGAHVAMKRQP